jgi:hypothetical protein
MRLVFVDMDDAAREALESGVRRMAASIRARERRETEERAGTLVGVQMQLLQQQQPEGPKVPRVEGVEDSMIASLLSRE